MLKEQIRQYITHKLPDIECFHAYAWTAGQRHQTLATRCLNRRGHLCLLIRLGQGNDNPATAGTGNFGPERAVLRGEQVRHRRARRVVVGEQLEFEALAVLLEDAIGGGFPACAVEQLLRFGGVVRPGLRGVGPGTRQDRAVAGGAPALQAVSRSGAAWNLRTSKSRLPCWSNWPVIGIMAKKE